MAENSVSSPKNDKRAMKSTSALTPADELEILQQSVLNCQHSGIKVGVTTLYMAGRRSVIIVLDDVDVKDNNLVLIG